MGKFYLPTSSLNFNNIFAGESISPAAYYAQRDFGYRRFALVEPNPYQNCLLLYNKLPRFTINDPVNDNYPIIFEFEDNEYIEKAKCVYDADGLKIYQLTSTLYLDPFSVKIYFSKPDEYHTTLIKSEASLETKLINFYKPCISTIPLEIISFNWSRSLLSNIADSTPEATSREIMLDKKIDCIKGFVISYLLAANQSTSEDIIELKQLYRNIKNDVSGILNLLAAPTSHEEKYKSKKNRPTGKHAADSLIALKNSISRFNELVSGIDYTDKFKSIDISSILTSYEFKREEVEKVINFLKNIKLKEYTLYDYFIKSVLAKDPGSKLLQTSDNLKKLVDMLNPEYHYRYEDYNRNKSEAIEAIFHQLENKIEEIERKYNEKAPRQNFNDVFAIANFRLTDYFDTSSSTKNTFYPSLVNEMMDMSVSSSEEFKVSRVDLAVAGGKIFKESMGASWENSQERTYINNLLTHVQSYTSFNVKSHSNLMLQSFASFIIKGDDPEKLIDFLIANQVKDFRIALGLWGAVFGFSALPRTLTKDFYSNGDEYFKQFYNCIAKQILNYDADNIEFKVSQIKHMQPEPTIEVRQEEVKSAINLPPATIAEDHNIPSQENLKVSTSIAVPKCPLCGADMVPRIAGKGKWIGQEFWGCSNYSKTKCKGNLDVIVNQNKPDKTNKQKGEKQYVNIYHDEPLHDVDELNQIVEDIIIQYMSSKQSNHIKISEVLPFINNKISRDYNVKNIETLLASKSFKRLKAKKKAGAGGIIRDDKLFF